MSRPFARRGNIVFLLVAASVAGCSEITLRQTMNRVQERYVRLVDVIEARPTYHDARQAARELRSVFATEPAIVASDPSRGPEFREHLEAMMRALDGFESFPSDLDQEHFLRLRSTVSSACQGCHDRFRKTR